MWRFLPDGSGERKTTGLIRRMKWLVMSGGWTGRKVPGHIPITLISTRRLASLCSLLLGSGKSIWEFPKPT